MIHKTKLSHGALKISRKMISISICQHFETIQDDHIYVSCWGNQNYPDQPITCFSKLFPESKRIAALHTTKATPSIIPSGFQTKHNVILLYIKVKSFYFSFIILMVLKGSWHGSFLWATLNVCFVDVTCDLRVGVSHTIWNYRAITEKIHQRSSENYSCNASFHLFHRLYKAEEVGLGGWWGGPWCRS